MELKLNLSYLKFFYDAALMGSVSESARRNFISQSAVSQAIAKLEKSLGVSLCQHKKQQFKLTEEGQLIFQRAQEIFSSVRQLYDAIDHHRQQARMPLNFVSTHSIGLSVLPEFIALFEQKSPEVALHFQFGGLTQIKGWLKQGIAEFAFVLDSPNVAEYQQLTVHKGYFHLYKHKEEKSSLDACGIYVEHAQGMLVAEYQQSYQAHFKKSLPIRAELNSWEFIARCMETGKGYGFLPDLIAFGKRHPHLIPMKSPMPKLPYSLCIIHPKGTQLSYSAKTFLDYFSSYLKDQLSN